MPIIKSAIKRAKQTIKRRERNIGIKKDIKTATNAFIAAPSAKGLSAAQSELDTAVKKGLLKRNTVARRKALLSKIAKNAGVKFVAGAEKVVAEATPKATVKKAAAKPTAKKVVAKKPVAKKAAK
jgi:ribosomal protein S20